MNGGLVLAQIAGLHEVFGTDSSWHWALSAYSLLVLLCFVLYPEFPESPKYLFIVAGKRDLARRGTKRLPNTHFQLKN